MFNVVTHSKTMALSSPLGMTLCFLETSPEAPPLPSFSKSKSKILSQTGSLPNIFSVRVIHIHIQIHIHVHVHHVTRHPSPMIMIMIMIMITP